MKHTLRSLNGVLLLMAVLVVAVFAQSYNGRQAVVAANLRTCVNTVHARVLSVNAFRAEATADRKVAADPRQSQKTRAALGGEAATIETTLKGIDRLIDPHYETFQIDNRHVTLNPKGRTLVAALGSTAYSCARANPSASPWQFFG